MRQSGEGEFDLYLIPALGGPEQKIYEFDALSLLHPEAGPILAWAPDGRWLAVRCRTEAPGGSGLCLLSPQTRELQPLTTPGMEFLGDTSPAFSPDGASLAFVRQDRFQGGNLYILDLDHDLRAASEPVRLTSGNRWVASPVWTPLGGEIIFSAADETESNFALWRIRASSGSKATPFFPLAARSVLSISKGNSSNRARLVYTMQVSDRNVWKVQLPGPGEKIAPVATPFLATTRTDAKAQFSPDGREIAFVSSRSGPEELWLCDSDGSNIRPLTNLGATIVGPPRWSPDGRRIVFHARLQGKADVYVIYEGGGLPQRLTPGVADEAMPNWSRDGRWVYFSRRVGGESQLWKRPAEGGEAIQLTSQGGWIAFEASDGRTVHYSKRVGVMGVFQMPVAERLLEGPESRLLDSVVPASFFVAENRIYFIEGKVDGYGENLKYLDLTSGQVFIIAPIHHPVGYGLTASPDGRTLLYTQVDSVNSDLMMLDEFQ
jgi:Tol biopolymer transport system component